MLQVTRFIELLLSCIRASFFIFSVSIGKSLTRPTRWIENCEFNDPTLHRAESTQTAQPKVSIFHDEPNSEPFWSPCALSCPSFCPFLLHIILPIILVDIVTLSHIHTFQTKTLEVGTNLGVSIHHSCGAQLRYAFQASTLGDLGTPFLKSITVKNIFDRLLVMFMNWPDTCLADGEIVSEEWIFLAVAILSKKVSYWVK